MLVPFTSIGICPISFIAFVICLLTCWSRERSCYLTLSLSPGLLWPHIFLSERPTVTSTQSLPPCSREERRRTPRTATDFEFPLFSPQTTA